MNRRCESTFYRPTGKSSRPQCSVRDAERLRPVFFTSGYPVESEKDVVSFIAILFVNGGPVAIVFAVTNSIVSPFYAMRGGRPWSHVGKESHERSAPFLRHGDAASTVSFIARGIRIVTPLHHIFPNFVLRQMAESMRLVGCAGSFSVKTSAALGKAPLNVVPADGHYFAALTLAVPRSVPVFIASSVLNDRQSPKNLPRQIFHAGRNGDRIHVSHDDSPKIRLVRDAAGCNDPVAFRHLYPNYLAA
jgi:hypothetical protein